MYLQLYIFWNISLWIVLGFVDPLHVQNPLLNQIDCLCTINTLWYSLFQQRFAFVFVSLLWLLFLTGKENICFLAETVHLNANRLSKRERKHTHYATNFRIIWVFALFFPILESQNMANKGFSFIFNMQFWLSGSYFFFASFDVSILWVGWMDGWMGGRECVCFLLSSVFQLLQNAIDILPKMAKWNQCKW